MKILIGEKKLLNLVKKWERKIVSAWAVELKADSNFFSAFIGVSICLGLFPLSKKLLWYEVVSCFSYELSEFNE